jgi:small subunit ribosomal protein S3
MGQKIHPVGFRLPVTRNWSSRWYASNKNFASMLAEDLRVRIYIKAKLKAAAVSRILIERPAKNARITIFSARPGVVIGKKGEDIEHLKLELTKLLGVPVAVNIEEVRKPEVDAQLIADSITQQLEKRIMFRRAMKRAMQNAMRLGALGIKLMSSGRLNGIEIARCEWYREGRVPLHTLRADIDYGFSEAKTTYGIIGVKCWVYKGDRVLSGELSGASSSAGLEDDRRLKRGSRGGLTSTTAARPRLGAVEAELSGRVDDPLKTSNMSQVSSLKPPFVFTPSISDESTQDSTVSVKRVRKSPVKSSPNVRES